MGLLITGCLVQPAPEEEGFSSAPKACILPETYWKFDFVLFAWKQFAHDFKEVLPSLPVASPIVLTKFAVRWPGSPHIM